MYKTGVLPLNYGSIGSGLSSTVTHVAYVCGRERLYIKMAESVGVEPTQLLSQLYGLAIRCITILPTLHLFKFPISLLLKTNSTTLLLNFIQCVFKQDGSEVCLFNANRVVSWIDSSNTVLVSLHNSIAM